MEVSLRASSINDISEEVENFCSKNEGQRPFGNKVHQEDDQSPFPVFSVKLFETCFQVHVGVN